MIDHLVYATPQLDRTLDELSERFGVRAIAGGQHPGFATRNAIVSLGPRTYLEIIGPDPDQPDPASPRWFGIDTLTAPRLVTWAAAAPHLAELVARAHSRGIPLGAVADGQRQRPDGVLLRWQLTNPAAMIAEGIVPFFIDWGDSSHPATSATTNISLRRVEAEHPDATTVRGWLTTLDVEIPVREAPHAALTATFDTPRGTVVLR